MTTSTKEHMNLRVHIESKGLEVKSNRSRLYSVRLESTAPGSGNTYIAKNDSLTLGELVEVLAAIDRSHSLHPHFTIPYLQDSGTELDRVDRK